VARRDRAAGRANIWTEDPAQDGTSTGNVAWAALALLTLHEATYEGRYLTDAGRPIDWIIVNTSCGDNDSGRQR
jgi:hypothetical protein